MDKAFVAEIQKRISEEKYDLNIPKQQKRAIAIPSSEIATQHKGHTTLQTYFWQHHDPTAKNRSVD
jgi:hypothetical protein